MKSQAWQRGMVAIVVSAGAHLAAATVVAGAGAALHVGADYSPRLTVRLNLGAARAPAAVPSPVAAAATMQAEEATPAEDSRAPQHAGLIPAVKPYYYPGSELDRRPHPITAVELGEPGPEVREGYLILKLLIDEAGKLDDAIVVVNDGGEQLAREAREAFAKARYAPGVRSGQPVKSEMMIEVKLDRPRS